MTEEGEYLEMMAQSIDPDQRRMADLMTQIEILRVLRSIWYCLGFWLALIAIALIVIAVNVA